MRWFKAAALLLVVAVIAASAIAEIIAPAGYEQQFRDNPNEAPSWRFLLGTDDLGRDRFSRLLHGSRVSLVLAPIAATIATLIALLLGLLAGHFGGRLDSIVLACADLCNSIPLLFLLIATRAVLPLDVGPIVSVVITFSLLGLCGWASGVRIIRAAVRDIKLSGYVLQGRALGYSSSQLTRVHVVSGLRAVVFTQFCLYLPQFLMAEANLGMLGLGVTEPLPSWGNLLTELQNISAITASPWRLAPSILLILMLGSIQLLIQKRRLHP